MTDALRRVRDAYPPIFFQTMVEYFDSAFAEALALARDHIERPEQPNMLGQLRHARCEAWFRKAAAESDVNVHVLNTQPAGGRYSLVSANDVYLIRSNIQIHCGPPRPTAFRRAWAALNHWLNPLQLDLLRKVEAAPSNRLCGVIVTTSHPRHGDPSVPAFVGLGIPRADLSSWVTLVPLTTLLGLYHDAEGRSRAPIEAPVEIKDQAIPKLKRRTENDA